ncbi:MAG: hypothetical protein NTU48_07885 [Legionellales bacterium]|nr:hypothetical protein [Legionellales bacterium]
MKKIALAMLVLFTTLSAATLSSVAYAEGSCGCGTDGCGDNTISADAPSEQTRSLDILK